MEDEYMTKEQVTYIWLTCQFYDFGLSEGELDCLSKLIADGCS